MEPKKTGKAFILDTNVILHDSSCIYKFQDNDVVVPIQVVEELDSFKKGFETKNFHAREFCRILDELLPDNIFNDGVPLGKDLGKLKIYLAITWNDKVKENLKEQNVDAEIINLAYTLKETSPDKEVIIVSKDVNLRLKAKALGVLAQDFLHETITNVDSLFEEVRTIEAENSFIDKLYKEKGSIEYSIKDAVQNQNFILKNEKQSALVRYKDGSVIPIRKDNLHAFNLKAKNSEQMFALDVLLN